MASLVNGCYFFNVKDRKKEKYSEKMEEGHQKMREETSVLGSQKPLPMPLSYSVSLQFFSAGFKFSGNKMNLQPHSSVVKGFSERRESFRTS